MIIQHDRTFRNHRLFPVIRSDLFSAGSDKIILNAGFAVLVEIEHPPHHFRTYFFCHIILCRPEPPGEDQNIRARKCKSKTLCHSLFIITHHRLIIHREAKSGTLFCQILGICIYNVTEKKLCSHGNNLCCHITCRLF